MTEREKQALKLCKKGVATTRELAKLMDCSNGTAHAVLRALVAAGKVEFYPAAWRVTDGN